MHSSTSLTAAVLAAILCAASSFASVIPRQEQAQEPTSNYVGYLISTFSDANPAVQWHLSNGNSASSFTFLNSALPILNSTVGTRGVRDIYLTTNTARNQWFLLATDLDINAPGFSWSQATRTGSRGIVVWKSEDLVDWNEARLVEVEDQRAGMVWAPSAIWSDKRGEWDVFWSSRLYDEEDKGHAGKPSLDRIRVASTKDFVTFDAARDYLSLEDTPLIDQEFQKIDALDGGGWARFLKNATSQQVYQEVSEREEDVFGDDWRRVEGYVRDESPREGAAVFKDNVTPGLYHMLLDDYTEYLPFETDDIVSGKWTPSGCPDFPRGLKHGSVTPLMQKEYDAVSAEYKV